MNSNLAFFFDWIRAPLRTGAVLPSGNNLAQAMAEAVENISNGTIIELGAGTGSVTRALVEMGVDPQRIVSVEMNERFCAKLKRNFPGLVVAQADAYDLKGLVERYEIEQVTGIVSSLPLLTRPTDIRAKFLQDSMDILSPGAPLVQFTYQMNAPIMPRDSDIHVSCAARVWMNVPPATVWTYKRPGKA